MTENATEARKGRGVGEPVAAPKDAPEDTATGFAVYDRTLARFVGPVHTDRPSRSDADKAVAEGHVAAVVRV